MNAKKNKTTILTNEFESSEFLDRWVKAVRRGTPMVVSDAEDVKDTYPDEYRLYERLGIKSSLRFHWNHGKSPDCRAQPSAVHPSDQYA